MSKITKIASHLSQGFKWLLPFLLIGLILPVLVLIGFGFLTLWERGYALHYVAFVTASTGLVYLVFWLWSRKHDNAISSQEEQTLVEPSTDWSDFDNTVWEDMKTQVDLKMENEIPWNDLFQHSIDLFQQTATLYGKGEYEFTVPESLKLIEEVSRRYRLVLKENIPLVEKLKVSHLKYTFDQKGTIQQGSKAYKVAHNIYRALRVVNPVSAAMAEARKLVVDEFVKKLSVESQVRLKRALFDEVVSVSIDLYSGRFRIDDEDVDVGKAIELDQTRAPIELDPIRICFIGQISSGKSSMVNALTGLSTAEVNRLPSTDQVVAYQTQLPDDTPVHLIDLPGLDGDAKTNERLLHEIQQSDVVVWVLKANQSSRSLDTEFLKTLNEDFLTRAHRSRKKPPILGVVNQIDLLSQQNQQLTDAVVGNGDSVIDEALTYNKSILAFTDWLALSLVADTESASAHQLIEKFYELRDKAQQTQLNRRRVEAAESFNASEQFKRVGRAGKSLLKLWMQTERPNPQSTGEEPYDVSKSKWKRVKNAKDEKR